MNNRYIGVPTVLREGVQAPERATEGAAAFDLRAYNKVVVGPFKTALVTTGIRMAIPRGMAGLVLSRSGMALNHSVWVANAPGLIDSDYRGVIGVILYNGSHTPYHVNPGDRVAQLMFTGHGSGYVELELVDMLEDTERGEGGFGSTGAK